MITQCWDWGRSRNATHCSLCTHIKFARTHTDCKLHVSVWIEHVLLDPKAVTVPVNSSPQAPAPYGQQFSWVAHVWQGLFLSTAVAPWLQGAPRSPQFVWELESSWYCGLIPHRVWVLPALWLMTSWKYPQSWSLGFTEVVNPTSHHSHTQGNVTTLRDRGGFVMISDALLQFMPFSCLQPSADRRGSWLSPNAMTWRKNFSEREGGSLVKLSFMRLTSKWC